MLDGADLDFGEANFPRKQLRRKTWRSLNGRWKFLFDNDTRWLAPGDIKEWQHVITVPFAPESIASGLGDTGFHARIWYQRSFEWERKSDKRVFLHFGAVDYEAYVWVNGNFVGSHIGGHTPFSFEITDCLVDGPQIVTVRADDDPFDLAKPRGKQDWQLEPHSIWYYRTSGIWQTVWLEEVALVFIERIRWTPLIERWEIGCEVFILGSAQFKDLQLKVKLSCNGRSLVEDSYKVINNEVHRRIALSDPGIDDFRNELLWSPERPTLIDAQLELWADGKLVDQVLSYTALRSVSVQRGRFLLNGRPYYLRLVLDQGYWTETLLTAPSADAFRYDIELVKAAGFNGVRKHQKIEDPDFFYWADVLGLIVWAEMPSAYRFTHESVERLTREWMEVIDRDSNHPSLAVWVPFNESWGVPDLAEKATHQNCVQALYHLTRTLDPTRPVIGNDGWESTATDILGIHDYDENPKQISKKYEVRADLNDILNKGWPGGRMLTVDGHPYRGQPIMLTEFGGIACISSEQTMAEKKHTWGYSICRTPEELRARYEALLWAVHRVEIFAGFCYTQFTDTFQEANGLFFMDRTPKFPIQAMAAATKNSAFTHGEPTVGTLAIELERRDNGRASISGP